MEGNIETLKDVMKTIAIKNVIKIFPQKIVELNELLEDKRFKNGFDVAKDEPKIPVSDPINASKESKTKSGNSVENIEENSSEESSGVIQSAVVHGNPLLVEMVSILEPEMLEFTEYTLALSAGINLLMPPIEDGNNFGVEIQQECVDSTIGAENEIHHRMGEIQKYFSGRAELVAKALKCPNCEDFKLAIRERDRMFHRFLIISLTAIRNHYINLHDLVLKNLNKIKTPKTHNSNELLY